MYQPNTRGMSFCIFNWKLKLPQYSYDMTEVNYSVKVTGTTLHENNLH